MFSLAVVEPAAAGDRLVRSETTQPSAGPVETVSLSGGPSARRIGAGDCSFAGNQFEPGAGSATNMECGLTQRQALPVEGGEPVGPGQVLESGRDTEEVDAQCAALVSRAGAPWWV